MIECSMQVVRKKFTVDVSFTVSSGNVLCLFGPSGAGKSTILAIMAGFEKANKCRLYHDHEVIENTDNASSTRRPVWKRHFAYVEQTPRLFPHMTLHQNIAYASGSKIFDEELWQLIDRFELRDFMDKKPSALSGGYVQRGALVRALATKPKVLLLDEPFSALDWQSKEKLQDIFLEQKKQQPITTILVTHQIVEAQRLADDIGILDHGKLLQIGSVSDILNHPASKEVARMVGYTHFLKGSLFSLPTVDEIAIHPDRIVIGAHEKTGVVCSGVVSAITPREGMQRLYVDLLDGQSIIVTASAFQGLQVGDQLTITIPHPLVQFRES